MTEQPEPAAPAQPPAPSQPPQHPGFFDRLVHPGHPDAPGSPPAEIAHLTRALRIAVRIAEEPAFRPLLGDVLELAVSACGIAGKAAG